MKKTILFLSLFAFGLQIKAQDTNAIKKSAIIIKLGALNFKKTNHTDGLTQSGMNFGIGYIQGWTKNLDIVSNFQFASLKYPYYTSLKVPAATKAQDYISWDFNFNYKLRSEEQAIVPYITAGLGVGADHFSYYTAYFPVGLGVQVKSKQGSFLFLQATHNAEVSPITKMHQNYSIGYSLPLKLKDKKPVIIPDAPVRVDGDNDGVVDSLDQCPNQKGLAKYNGCPIPDSDNDGVDDELDKCPNQAGTVKYKGCPIPDTDKDGINDEMDKCPTVSGLTRYGGCPIPDTDKDGINDEVDKCPNTPGIAGNNGCIDIQPLLEQAASNLKFASGKVILSKKNFAGLDSVISLLNTYTNITLLLGGNTDNVGSKKVNQPLSEKRATVVYKYLVKKGISPARLIKEGFADTKPIADNKTAKGRAKNRRTDLNAKY